MDEYVSILAVMNVGLERLVAEAEVLCMPGLGIVDR